MGGLGSPDQADFVFHVHVTPRLREADQQTGAGQEGRCPDLVNVTGFKSGFRTDIKHHPSGDRHQHREGHEKSPDRSRGFTWAVWQLDL